MKGITFQETPLSPAHKELGKVCYSEWFYIFLILFQGPKYIRGFKAGTMNLMAVSVEKGGFCVFSFCLSFLHEPETNDISTN